ncbi:MAG: phosphatase PAP2 family protein [Sphaerochaetaceae bacterium]|nr:phosphatase PAP2 family protein [Sphaerochaetaceae bacterium]
MDIACLLMLQEFRNGIGGIFADFFAKMTFLGERSTIYVILAVLYWCVNKELGTYLLMGWNSNRLLNSFAKVTACVYRPWIRDARIVPYGNMINTATGYSFPSGHTMNGGSLFLGLAVRREFSKLLRISAFCFALLIGLSRNYLGVHTPQDVIVGLALSALVMYLTQKLLEWVEKNPESDIKVAMIGIAVAIIIAIYAALKPYPIGYDSQGKILVEGIKMAKDTFKAVGYLTSFLVGWLLERRYVRFTTDIPFKERLERLVVGLLGLYFVSLIISPVFKSNLPGIAGTVIYNFIEMFYVTFLFPFIMVHFRKS